MAQDLLCDHVNVNLKMDFNTATLFKSADGDDERVNKELPIYKFRRHGATLRFIWSRICGHLVDIS